MFGISALDAPAVSSLPRRDRAAIVGRLLPVAATIAGLLCLWRVRRLCMVAVPSTDVAVLYDTRRRRVLATTLSVNGCAARPKRRTARGAGKRQGCHRRSWLSRLLVHEQGRLLLCPPSSFFHVFMLPRSALEEPGELVTCTIEQLALTDGEVRLLLSVQYVIPASQLARYLAAVGPQPPNEAIGIAAAQVARIRGNEVSVGILLSRARREAIFLGLYKDHLATKLMSEMAIQLIDITVDYVELLGA